jgi:hypothetical protein
MPRIETRSFGPHQVVDDNGRLLFEDWDRSIVERFLFELTADQKRRDGEDAASRIFGL